MIIFAHFFVDIDVISNTSSVNRGLYHFRNEISFFKILTLSSILNFIFVFFMNDFLYKTDKK